MVTVAIEIQEKNYAPGSVQGRVFICIGGRLYHNYGLMLDPTKMRWLHLISMMGDCALQYKEADT